jgi:hypothetical protein
MNLIDRFAAGLETLGKKANQALDEGRLRMDLLRERRRMDQAARELGYVTYRQGKGEQPLAGEIESLVRRITESETEAARLAAQIAQLRKGGSGAATAAPATDGGATADGPAAPAAASPPPAAKETPKA